MFSFSSPLLSCSLSTLVSNPLVLMLRNGQHQVEVSEATWAPNSVRSLQELTTEFCVLGALSALPHPYPAGNHDAKTNQNFKNLFLSLFFLGPNPELLREGTS